MTQKPPLAHLVDRDPETLPDAVGPGALALQRLRRSGLVARLEAMLPLSRRAGYTATPLFAALAVFLLAGPGLGIRPFLQGLGDDLGRRIAALVGRRALPSASAVSRALSGLSHRQVRPFLDGLLCAPLSGTGILGHPGVQHLDAHGEGWHVLDVDPTVKASRRRELPEGEEFFAAERRSPGEAGYVGRKRGDVRTRAVPILHDGAGLWLGLRLLPTEGPVVPALCELVEHARSVLAVHGVAPERTVFRGDAEFGSASALRSFVDRGVHALARISRYGLLDTEASTAQLEHAVWLPVRRGESGVPREAADLGTFRLVGSTEDRPEVEVRVVVSRVPCSAQERPEREKGIRRGGFILELFATTLCAERWPAPDLVELFAGRSSIENRLGQEDRSFDLDRTFSQNPAGQELVRGIGLFLWNEQVCAGWRAKPPPATPRSQQRRPPVPAPRGLVERPPAAQEPPPAEPSPPAPPAEHAAVPESEPAAVPSSDPTPDSAAPSGAGDAAVRELGALLDRAFADLRLHQGWTIDATAARVRCPGGQALAAYHVSRPKDGSPRISVRTEPNACVGCPFREACFPDDRRSPYKQIGRALAPSDVEIATSALAEIKKKPVSPPLTKGRRPAPAQTRPRVERPPSHPVWQAPAPAEPGPWIAERPVFLPADARRRAGVPPGKVVRLLLRDVGPPKTRRLHSLLAADRADRAHRRRTREQIASQGTHCAVTSTRVTVQPQESTTNRQKA